MCRYDKPEHVVHVLQVLMVQEPDVPVLVVLVKRDGKAVGNVQDTLTGPRPQEQTYNPLLVSNFPHPVENNS